MPPFIDWSERMNKCKYCKRKGWGYCILKDRCEQLFTLKPCRPQQYCQGRGGFGLVYDESHCGQPNFWEFITKSQAQYQTYIDYNPSNDPHKLPRGWDCALIDQPTAPPPAPSRVSRDPFRALVFLSR